MTEAVVDLCFVKATILGDEARRSAPPSRHGRFIRIG